MVFDNTVTLGAILIVLGNAVVAIVYVLRMEAGMKVFAANMLDMSRRLTKLEERIEGIVATGTRLATIEERLNNQVAIAATTQQEVADLRRGRGWIQRDGREGLAGEYGGHG